MFWKKYDTWFKGALIGLVISFIISIGLSANIPILGSLASPGLHSCYFLTQCTSQGMCSACIVIGLMLNLFFGFIIGAVIGAILDKNCCKKRNIKVAKKQDKNKKRKK